MYFFFYFDMVLEGFDLFKVFSVGMVGVVKGFFEFLDVGFVFFFDVVDFSFVVGFNFYKGVLEFFNGVGIVFFGKRNWNDY